MSAIPLQPPLMIWMDSAPYVVFVFKRLAATSSRASSHVTGCQLPCPFWYFSRARTYCAVRNNSTCPCPLSAVDIILAGFNWIRLAETLPFSVSWKSLISKAPLLSFACRVPPVNSRKYLPDIWRDLWPDSARHHAPQRPHWPGTGCPQRGDV